jgi:hypothetical protein
MGIVNRGGHIASLLEAASLDSAEAEKESPPATHVVQLQHPLPDPAGKVSVESVRVKQAIKTLRERGVVEAFEELEAAPVSMPLEADQDWFEAGAAEGIVAVAALAHSASPAPVCVLPAKHSADSALARALSADLVRLRAPSLAQREQALHAYMRCAVAMPSRQEGKQDDSEHASHDTAESIFSDETVESSFSDNMFDDGTSESNLDETNIGDPQMSGKQPAHNPAPSTDAVTNEAAALIELIAAGTGPIPEDLLELLAETQLAPRSAETQSHRLHLLQAAVASIRERTIAGLRAALLLEPHSSASSSSASEVRMSVLLWTALSAVTGRAELLPRPGLADLEGAVHAANLRACSGAGEALSQRTVEAVAAWRATGTVEAVAAWRATGTDTTAHAAEETSLAEHNAEQTSVAEPKPEEVSVAAGVGAEPDVSAAALAELSEAARVRSTETLEAVTTALMEASGRPDDESVAREAVSALEQFVAQGWMSFRRSDAVCADTTAADQEHEIEPLLPSAQGVRVLLRSWAGAAFVELAEDRKVMETMRSRARAILATADIQAAASQLEELRAESRAAIMALASLAERLKDAKLAASRPGSGKEESLQVERTTMAYIDVNAYRDSVLSGLRELSRRVGPLQASCPDSPEAIALLQQIKSDADSCERELLEQN